MPLLIALLTRTTEGATPHRRLWFAGPVRASVCLLAAIVVCTALAPGHLSAEGSRTTAQKQEAEVASTGSLGTVTEYEPHGDPIAPVLIAVVVIIPAARIGGHVFEVIGQPAVLGELVVGVILGNLTLIGIDAFEFLKVDYSQHRWLDLQDFTHFAGVTVDHLARIGVILLLFRVGLETSVAEMRKVGASALLVAVIGVIVPTFLGWGAVRIMLPHHQWPVHMFVGAKGCTTKNWLKRGASTNLKKPLRRWPTCWSRSSSWRWECTSTSAVSRTSRYGGTPAC